MTKNVKFFVSSLPTRSNPLLVNPKIPIANYSISNNPKIINYPSSQVCQKYIHMFITLACDCRFGFLVRNS